MATRETEQMDRAVILKKIDAIAQELVELRKLILATEPPRKGLTEHLLGCLGSEPIEDYDYNLDWARFSDEPPA